jgi:signal transduction histidine kinase
MMGVTGGADTTVRKKVLVIDDELGPRESVRFLFKDQYQVFCEVSVEKGIERLQRESPDIVILDIRMPGKSGLEGLREIRNVDPDVSVVMLTGFGSIETAREAMRLGANDYVKKPFDTTEMRDVVLRHIGRTELMRIRSKATQDIASLNKQLLDQVGQKDRMAELGVASSGLLHDLRNPLTAIYGYVHLLSDDLAKTMESDPQHAGNIKECLTAIEKSVQRCQEMADMWRDLGQRDPSRMSVRAVKELVAEAVEGIAPAAATAGVRLLNAGGPDGSRIMADAPQMYRALQNVFQNAVRATADGAGTVEVGWKETEKGVEIRVTDSGPGIPENLLTRVCEPGFTTRRESGGTGLGLFITRMVVENTHGGTFNIGNAPGGGTVATMNLPAVRPA